MPNLDDNTSYNSLYKELTPCLDFHGASVGIDLRYDGSVRHKVFSYTPTLFHPSPRPGSRTTPA